MRACATSRSRTRSMGFLLAAAAVATATSKSQAPRDRHAVAREASVERVENGSERRPAGEVEQPASAQEPVQVADRGHAFQPFAFGAAHVHLGGQRAHRKAPVLATELRGGDVDGAKDPIAIPAAQHAYLGGAERASLVVQHSGAGARAR